MAPHNVHLSLTQCGLITQLPRGKRTEWQADDTDKTIKQPSEEKECVLFAFLDNHLSVLPHLVWNIAGIQVSAVVCLGG